MSADERIHEHTAGRDPIRAYVQQLAAELDGCDVALRHDALIDAEVHLRSAVRAGATAERAIADYGAPAEIARAYRESTGAGPSLAAGASTPPLGAMPLIIGLPLLVLLLAIS